MLRKFVIGGAVLGVLLLVYASYLRLDPGTEIDLNAVDELGNVLSDEPLDVPTGTGGEIVAGVNLMGLEGTHFVHTDEDGRVDRKLGFDQLIHSDNDQWIMTNPYLDLFMGDVLIRVTADRGKVEAKKTLGEPQAGDAEFEGNVVIRILPSDPNDPMTAFIYLDDVAFLADQSRFSTIGAVRLVSRAAQLVGRGLELIYDAPSQRLRLFRVRQMDSLRLSSEEFESLEGLDESKPADANEPALGAAAAVATAPVEAATPPVDPNAAPEGDIYRCIFRRNVQITTPEQVVTARDRLVINNILWADSKEEESDEPAAPAEASAPAPAEPNQSLPGPLDPASLEPNEPDDLPYPGPDALDTTASRVVALELIDESTFDIVVTCDGGFVVAPEGSPELRDQFEDVVFASRLEAKESPTAPTVDPNRHTASAHRIEFDATTNNATLVGPVALTFTLNASDLTDHAARGETIPVTVTARDAVRYLPGPNRIQLEGYCVVAARQSDPNYIYDYKLAAEVLTLDLMDDPNAESDATSVTLKRFTTSGGPVALYAGRTAGGAVVGKVELEAAGLDYDAANELFTLIGPGELDLRNEEDLDPDADPNEVSIERPCIVLMKEFDMLTYSGTRRLITADAQSGAIELTYLSQVSDAALFTTARHVEMQLVETAEEGLELALLTASGGISYEDDKNTFSGAILSYDRAQSLVIVEGGEGHDCMLNTALVPWIEMNLETDEILTQIQTPTTLQLIP